MSKMGLNAVSLDPAPKEDLINNDLEKNNLYPCKLLSRLDLSPLAVPETALTYGQTGFCPMLRIKAIEALNFSVESLAHLTTPADVFSS